MTYAEKVLDEIEKGNYEEARKHFGWSLRKDSDDMIYSLAEELYSLGFSNMAKRAYQTLLERYPDEDSLKTALADIAISEGEDDEALEYLSSITPDSEAYLQALLVSADLYQTQGMFEVSEQKLLQALDLAPDEEIIRFALAELYYNIKQYKQAIPIYLDLIKQGNFSISQVNLVQRLGMSYALSGQFNLLTDLAVFAVWVFYVLTFIGVIKLRKDQPNLHRPYKVPMYPVIPLVAILGGLFVVVNQLAFSGMKNTVIALGGVIITLIGLPVYSYTTKKNGNYKEKTKKSA